MIDAVERLLEFLPRNQIQFRNGLLRVRDGLQQIVAPPGQEREPLLALVVFLERHHVHRTHRFDAILHLPVIRLRGRQLFPADKRRFRRDQVLRLRIYFRYARLAQVLPVRIIPRALHFRVAPLLAHVLQRLAPHAQMIFHVRYARPTALPLLLQFALPRLQPQLLGAQSFELHRKLLALLPQRCRFFADRGLLLPQRRLAPLQFPALLLQPLGYRLCCGKALVHRCQLGPPARQLVLLELNRSAQLHQLVRKPRALRLRLRSRRRRCRQLMLGSLRPQPRVIHILLYPRQFALAKRQFQSQPRQARLRLLVTILRRKNLPVRPLLPRATHLQRLFRRAQLRAQRLDPGARFFAALFQLRNFAIQRPQFPLHSQRPRFIRAPAGHHAPLIASSIRRDERLLWSLAREFFRRHSAVRQIRRPQPRQELFRRRPQRIPESHQLIEPRNHAVFRPELHTGCAFGQLQIPQRIHKERRAPAHLIAQQPDSRARLVDR